MRKVAFVGWRGMVGSVLRERLKQGGDFRHFDWTFFSTSQQGEKAPTIDGEQTSSVGNAFDVDELAKYDIVLTCQGGDYSREIYPKLRSRLWQGFWIDAASALRMQEESVLILDPINGKRISQALEMGKKTFVGPNCTVSLMLLSLGRLITDDLVEWVSSMTYQAASGAGAQQMAELVEQMKEVGGLYRDESPLDLEKSVTNFLQTKMTKKSLGHPLACSLLPWIDEQLENGQSREEWKSMVEANKLLGYPTDYLKIDGTCVRVGAMRCHSQGLTVKLKRNLALNEVEEMIKNSHEWIKFVPNDKERTLKELTPAAVSGTLDIAVGRVRKMSLGEEYINLFTVGDQLLWGAAEPLRRMLQFILRANF